MHYIQTQHPKNILYKYKKLHIYFPYSQFKKQPINNFNSNINVKPSSNLQYLIIIPQKQLKLSKQQQQSLHTHYLLPIIHCLVITDMSKQNIKINEIKSFNQLQIQSRKDMNQFQHQHQHEYNSHNENENENENIKQMYKLQHQQFSLQLNNLDGQSSQSVTVKYNNQIGNDLNKQDKNKEVNEEYKYKQGNKNKYNASQLLPSMINKSRQEDNIDNKIIYNNQIHNFDLQHQDLDKIIQSYGTHTNKQPQYITYNPNNDNLNPNLNPYIHHKRQLQILQNKQLSNISYLHTQTKQLLKLTQANIHLQQQKQLRQKIILITSDLRKLRLRSVSNKNKNKNKNRQILSLKSQPTIKQISKIGQLQKKIKQSKNRYNRLSTKSILMQNYLKVSQSMLKSDIQNMSKKIIYDYSSYKQLSEEFDDNNGNDDDEYKLNRLKSQSISKFRPSSKMRTKRTFSPRRKFYNQFTQFDNIEEKIGCLKEHVQLLSNIVNNSKQFFYDKLSFLVQEKSNIKKQIQLTKINILKLQNQNRKLRSISNTSQKKLSLARRSIKNMSSLRSIGLSNIGSRKYFSPVHETNSRKLLHVKSAKNIQETQSHVDNNYLLNTKKQEDFKNDQQGFSSNNTSQRFSVLTRNKNQYMEAKKIKRKQMNSEYFNQDSYF